MFEGPRDLSWNRLNRNEKLAWIAGFLDGEGYFTVSKRSGSAPSTPFVSATQNDLRPLDRIQEVFPGTLTDNGKGHQIWRIHGEPAVQVCRELLPFLSPPKRIQARTLIAFWANCRIGGAPGYRPKLTDSIKTLRWWYSEALSHLKHGRDAQGVPDAL